MLQHALVDSPCTQTSPHKENCLHVRIESERLTCLFNRQLRVEHVLSNGVTGHNDFVGRKEAFHAFIGHTYLLSFLGKEFIRNAGIGVLLLNEAGDSPFCADIKRRATCISAYTDGCHRLELAHNLTRHALTLPYFEEHDDVFQQMFTVESTDGKALNLISGSRNTLHFHAS